MKDMQSKFCFCAVVGVWVCTSAALLAAINIHMKEREYGKTKER